MKFLSRHESNAYLLLRLVFGFLFACHGASKIFGVLGTARVPPGLDIHYLSGVIELVGGVLIFLGLFTRLAAFISSGEMAVAYFTVHAKASFFPIVNRGELAVIYCFLALFIATRGAGKLGIDKS
jgi:putative oxidoreductase